MANKKIISDLPELYAKFLPDFFNQEIPNESFATCNNCAMVCSDESKRKNTAMRSFLPDLKCCTYYPKIPSYLIGGLLSDTDPLMEEGRRRIKEAIKNRVGISPMGVYPPKKYDILYSSGSGAFGNSKNLICPYYEKEKKNCTVWKYRETVCSTFYCKSVAAENGKTFWSTLNGYLFQIQSSLMQHILFSLNFTSEDILHTLSGSNNGQNNSLTAEDMDDLPPSDEKYKNLWKDWHGKEEEFYKKCYELVNTLTPKKFEEITGITQKIYLNELEQKRKKFINIPDNLKLNESLGLKVSEEGNYSIHLKEIDTSYDVPVEVIDSFDGKSTLKDTIAKLNNEHNIELDEEFILPLYQYRILTEQENKSK